VSERRDPVHAGRLTASLLAGAAAGVALAVAATLLVAAAVHRQAADRLRIDLDRLAHDAASVATDDARQEFVRSAARWLAARVTWIAADGRVVADSDVAPAELPRVESHAGRPEVVAALAGGFGEARRRSATVGERFVYVALRLEHFRPPAVLRIALPERDLERVETPYQTDVLLLGLFGGVLAGGAVARVLSRRDHDVAQLAEAVEQVARGGAAPTGRVAADLERIRSRLQDVAERAAAAERGGEGIRLLSRIVFEELPEALVVVDRRLDVLDANPAALRLFGISALPHSLLDLVRSAEVLAAFHDAIASGSSSEVGGSAGAAPPRPAAAHIAVSYLDESGADRSLEVSVRAIPGGSARGVPAAVGLVRDVTAREKTEAMRRQFVADVSHELRTPVASIRAAAETAEAEPAASPELQRLVEIIGRQARQMQDLVSDLTDLSQIETGAVTLQVERRPAGALLGGVVRDLAPAADAKELVVLLNVDNGLTIDGDPRRLAQVFRNLLDNAIKFSPRGARIDVTATKGAERDVIVSVRDYGTGIPKSEREKIFQRFYRVDPSRAKTVPGTGLGLAIVKHLLILHGGKVCVDSEVGKGSTFTVKLPARQAT
jgi:two-component system phosphate regulon sensor histidine kinase PhoR